MNFKEYIHFIKSDLYRHCGSVHLLQFIKYLFINIGFKYTFWMRTSAFFKTHKLLYLFYIISRLKNIRYTIKYGIDIPYNTIIGKGLYIGHFGGIIVNHQSIIGVNCNISAGVVIGQSNRGPKKGYPIIGNNVFIGPGAKIFGNIKIGNNVAIGANCVVTSDVPDNGVIIGIPGQIISNNGTRGYINRTDY